MGFATFQELPQHNITMPQFHAPTAPEQPVYNTQALIAPLLRMAEYMSPDARARRKAAVAKANYEYRLYQPGGLAEKQATWLYQDRAMKRNNDILRQRGLMMDNENKKRKLNGESPTFLPEEIIAAQHGVPVNKKVRKGTYQEAPTFGTISNDQPLPEASADTSSDATESLDNQENP